MYYFVMYEWALSSYGTFQEEVWVELWQNKIYSQSSLSKSGHLRKLNFVIFVANSFQIIIFCHFCKNLNYLFRLNPRWLQRLLASAGDFLCSGKIWIFVSTTTVARFWGQKAQFVVFLLFLLYIYYYNITVKWHAHYFYLHLFLKFQEISKNM